MLQVQYGTKLIQFTYPGKIVASTSKLEFTYICKLRWRAAGFSSSSCKVSKISGIDREGRERPGTDGDGDGVERSGTDGDRGNTSD